MDFGAPSGLDAPGPVVSRWVARLSAALMRGNAAVHRRAGYWTPPLNVAVEVAQGASLAHLVPEGPSSYELWVD